jgi:hypothetical protein
MDVDTMMQIIQDFKNWKKARVALSQSKDSVQKYKPSLIQTCDESTWNRNIKNENLFNECIPLPKDIDGLFNMVLHVHTNIRIINEAAEKYRATSCFYEFGKNVKQCINFSPNDSLESDVRCNTCPHFMFLKHFQKLNYDAVKKEQEYQVAKQKLLNNFIFWKQRTK